VIEAQLCQFSLGFKAPILYGNQSAKKKEKNKEEKRKKINNDSTRVSSCWFH